MLTYQESNDLYSTYLDSDGEEVYLAHGSFKRLVDFETIDLNDSWTEYQSINPKIYYDQEGWLNWLRSSITEPERADEIMWCDDCVLPLHEDDTNVIWEDGTACESCFGSYTQCQHCDEWVNDGSAILNGSYACEGCKQNRLAYCDDCDGYYDSNNDEDHDHDDEQCDCDSPQRQFTVRNDGLPPLIQDQRTSVSLPSGVISEEGMGRISRCLWDHARSLSGEERDTLNRLAYPEDLETHVGNKWQTGKGNFTKRLSKYVYDHNVKLPPSVISEVGNIASENSQGMDFAIEVTRDLNLSSEAFGNSGSCWWGSYGSSRCALKSNGGYALRSFDEDNDVSGRAWVLPLAREGDHGLTPTFETLAPAAFMVFNGYGDLSGYTPGRIVAHMAGLTYRKIGFLADPMYVNGESGCLVAPEDIAAHYTDGQIRLSLAEHATLFDSEREVLSHVA